MNSDETQSPEVELDVDAENSPEIETEGAEAVEEISPLEAMVAENAELKDRLLRSVAEMENLRKRTEREINDSRTYAIANFARDMLVATDNLSRALMTLPAEARENANASMTSLIEGVEMTEREMQRLLQKNGVKPIVAEGERFDPHKHQAMFEVPGTDAPDGTVVQVVQDGFEIGDRVLRPAMVGVAKGGLKPAPEAPTPEGGHVDKEA